MKNFWSTEARVSESENGELKLPFLLEEVGGVIMAMKAGSTPWPNIMKMFWPQLQPAIMKMFHEFYIATLDMARLNFGVITLIPKIVGAMDIRQFRPMMALYFKHFRYS